MFKKPSVKEVKTDIASLQIYLRATKKFGKTTLFRDMVLEKYGDPECGLLVGCGAEQGYAILSNLNTTQVETWQEMVELKDWLIKEKGKEHKIKLIGFDVVGELLEPAEEEIKKQSFKETGKIAKTFNASFGGWIA